MKVWEVEVSENRSSHDPYDYRGTVEAETEAQARGLAVKDAMTEWGWTREDRDMVIVKACYPRVPLFTPQHRVALIAALARTDRHDCGDISGPGLVKSLMNMLAADDPEFNRKGFETAIGPYMEAEDGDSYRCLNCGLTSDAPFERCEQCDMPQH